METTTTNTTPAEDLSAKLRDMNVAQIARVIRRNWPKVYFGAVPYLDAMGSMDQITDTYGMDDGKSIVRYFMSNASTWRGPVAKVVKAELKRRLK